MSVLFVPKKENIRFYDLTPKPGVRFFFGYEPAANELGWLWLDLENTQEGCTYVIILDLALRQETAAWLAHATVDISYHREGIDVDVKLPDQDFCGSGREKGWGYKSCFILKNATGDDMNHNICMVM